MTSAQPVAEHIGHLFLRTTAQFGPRPATRIADPNALGGWRVQTFSELETSVRLIAKALIAAGVQPGQRVAIFAHNCPEWTQADYAIALIGAVAVPIYATNTPPQIVHIAADCQVVAAFTGNRSETERFLVAQRELPGLNQIISFERTDLPVPDLEQFSQAGELLNDPTLDAELDARLEAVRPDDLYSLIYTSGTTGEPRGVMLSHAAMISQIRSLDQIFSFGPQEHGLCFLPLSHALERGWSLYIFTHGCLNTYLADTRKVAETLATVRPSLLVAVPKLFETVMSSARQTAGSSPVTKRLFEWAVRVGTKNQHAYRDGRRPGLGLRAQLWLADKFGLRKVREALGGRKAVMACGGAPLRPEVEEFIGACGLQVLQGYGLTEASPLVSFNRPDDYKLGTTGQAMPGGKVKIGADGEILYQGPNVMDGYWANPEATEQAFLDDETGRWLRTGDVGFLDDGQRLVVTDRIKDIIVTMGGKNIAPQPIEGLLLSDPLFEQAVLLGDNRPFLTLLVKPSNPQLAALAERLQEPYEQLTDLLSNQRILDEVSSRAKALTAKLPSHEQFKDLRVLFEDFSMENGLLTPTLKVKRREVEKRFGQLIDEMYAKVEQLRAGARSEEPGGSDPQRPREY